MFGAACKRVVDDGNSENVDLKDASTRRNFKNYIAVSINILITFLWEFPGNRSQLQVKATK